MKRIKHIQCFLFNRTWKSLTCTKVKAVFQWVIWNWQVNIKVLDVDEPPVFTQPNYTFTAVEERMVNNIGVITAKDPDRARLTIRYSAEQTSQRVCSSLLCRVSLNEPLFVFRYSILDKDCPISINPLTGQLSTLRTLDRELEATHMFQVKAQEEPNGMSLTHTHTHGFINPVSFKQ